MKIKIINFILIFFLSNSYAGTWTVAPQPIDNTTAISGSNVFSSVNSSGIYLVTWLDNSSGLPFYAVYNGTSWTVSPQSIPSSAAVNPSYDVISSVNASGEFLVTWQDNTSSFPYYAVFNGSSWTVSPQQIPMTNTTSSSVASSVNASGEFLVTWTDSGSSFPYYAVFNGSSWTVSPQQISMAQNIARGVFSSASPSGDFMATWIDQISNLPFYAIFNGSTWTTASSVDGTSGTASTYVFSTATSSGDFMATWQDGSTGLPTYAIYNGTSWTVSPTVVDGATDPVGFGGGVFPSVDSSGNFMVAWRDNATVLPIYAIYNGTSWIVPATSIDNTTTVLGGPIEASSASSADIFMVTWQENSTALPFFAIYSDSQAFRAFQRPSNRR